MLMYQSDGKINKNRMILFNVILGLFHVGSRHFN